MHTPKLPAAMAKNSRRTLLWALVMASVAVAQRVGFPPSNCARECGGIEVPYPFGLDNDPAGGRGICRSENSGFRLKCKYSYSPPKLFAGNIEVTGINISTARMGILQRISYVCFNNASGLPYDASSRDIDFAASRRLSSTENEFIAVGCETLVQFKIGNRTFGGCMSGCSSPEMADEGECSGFGCCRTPIPKDINWYSTNYYYRQNESMVYEFNPCSYFFVAEKGNYTFHRSDLMSMDEKRMFPVVLDWAMGRKGNLTCEEARRNESSYACVAANSECFNSINGPGYVCNCSRGYTGNPYLHGGCQDINECENKARYPCDGLCTNTPGDYECKCEDGYSLDPKTEKCVKSYRTLTLAIKLVIGIGSSIASVFIVSLAGYIVFQNRKIRILQEECFRRNGGVILQQALQNRRSTFKIFSMSELKRATDSFSKEHILGTGGYGVVYKGKVDDGRIVAIKRSTVVNEKNCNDFANELFILSEINHRNIVKIVGCCLEDEVPMLVYEFISRGTLFELIHRGSASIPFGVRLRMAKEAAEALKYLHTDVDPPILHGDVKSSNILLDENYTAKVSDFGTSKLAAKDKSQFTTFVQGTCGYLDPEYLINGYLTDKSDVFSFGVILVELLTRRLPFNFDASDEKERSLALKFISCAKGGKLEEILDRALVENDGMVAGVERVVEIALKCLKLQGEERPTMREVAMELESLEGVEMHQWTIPDESREAEHLPGGVEGATLETGTTTFQFFSVELPTGR